MKQAIRKKHLEKRKSLSAESLGQKSKKLASLLFETAEFKNARCIMAFVSINGEPETRGIIEEAWRQGKKVCVPTTDFAANEMMPVQINSFAELEEKKFGLPEPKSHEKKVAVGEIDLVLVPGVAFDERGNRIGYGKGFFDRFLAGSKVTAVGLCFEQHLEKELPCEAHDCRVGKIVTEERVIGC